MIGDNVRYLRKLAGYSQEQLARKLGITQGSVSLWEKGKTEPDTKTLVRLSQIFDVQMDYLISNETRRDLDAINIRRSSIPILGTIACGKQITPDTEPDGYADIPDGVHADFALRCKGDSMMPTFIDGDLVLIRQQPEVENGQIAAVSIDGETTLKHFYRQSDGITLIAENAAFAPIYVPNASDRQIIIHGRAIGYTRIFG